MNTHHAPGERDDSQDLERSLPPESMPWLFWVIIGALFCVGVVVIFFFDPSEASWFPPCLFHHVTGWYCPGCGTTRAVHQLVHGRLLAAFDYNPLMVLTLPFIFYALLSEVRYQVKGRHLPQIFRAWWWSWMVVGIVLAYWVLRNIPVYPFSYLAP